MATKLKNLRLTSVDLVRAGANQEADICLYKSAEQDPPTAQDEGIFKRFLNWLKDNPNEEVPEEPVEKDFVTFDQVNDNRENQDRLWRYIDALSCSLRSIQEDQGLGNQQRATQMQESVQQFTNAMNALIPRLCGMETQVVPAGYDVIEEV